MKSLEGRQEQEPPSLPLHQWAYTDVRMILNNHNTFIQSFGGLNCLFWGTYFCSFTGVTITLAFPSIFGFSPHVFLSPLTLEGCCHFSPLALMFHVNVHINTCTDAAFPCLQKWRQSAGLTATGGSEATHLVDSAWLPHPRQYFSGSPH